MQENQIQQASSPTPYIIGAAILILAILGYVFWPSPEPEVKPDPIEPAPQISTSPEISETPVERIPVTEEPELVEAEEIAPQQETEVETIEMEEQEPTIDISDGAVKASIMNTAIASGIASLLVDEDLLQRFVVLTMNISNQEIAQNHRLMRPPEQGFRVYRQAGSEWIDAASYKRYIPYVEAFESIDTSQLMALYQEYKPTLLEIYAEVGDGGDDFERELVDAIEHLLETPDVSMPLEVMTESVMYQYKDEELESLTAPQKQLLRTGPDNTRAIKAKLREILVNLQR